MLEFLRIDENEGEAIRQVRAVCQPFLPVYPVAEGVPPMAPLPTPVFAQRVRLHYPDRGDNQEWVAWTFDSPTLDQVTAEIQTTRPGVVAFQWWGC